MSKSDLVEAVDAALVQWNKGWKLIKDALKAAKSGNEPLPDKLRQLDRITANLRKQLRRFEYAIDDLDADTWHPWRTDYPQREKPIPFSTGEDLSIRCQDIIVRKFPVHSPTVEAWAVEVRGWFDQLRANTKTNTKKKKRFLLPQSPEVRKLCKKLKRDLAPGVQQIDVALDFTEGNRKKADNLLQQCRRYKHMWHPNHIEH